MNSVGGWEQLDREQFAEQVREALAHLYDHAYLQAHPLATSLGAGPGAQSAGRTLHRVLMQAIQRLRPPDEVSPHSASWRKYRYLQLRFVQARSAAQVAQELGISERQSQRDQRQAVDELICLLWGELARGAGPAGDTLPQPPPAAGDTLEHEVAKLGGSQEQEPTSLAEVVRGVLATVARLAADHSVRLAPSIPDSLPRVAAGRSAVRQAVLGLLLYGICRPGAIAVELAAAAGPGRVSLRLLVALVPVAAPAEPGAPPGTAADEADEAGNAGRLAVARRLIEMQGGLVRALASPERLQVEVELPSVPAGTVLLIDDNPDVLRLFERYLAGSVHRVLQARTAPEAVHLARTGRPDVITLDVMMPSQDGWEILQILKNDEETQAVPVVVCSVLRERELALSLGASDFLAKPINQQALLRAVLGCLAR